MDDKYEHLNPADDIFDHSEYEAELDHHSPEYDPEGFRDRAETSEPDYPEDEGSSNG